MQLVSNAAFLPGTLAAYVPARPRRTMTWGEQNTEAEAHEQLNYALEVGVNFIDTAE